MNPPRNSDITPQEPRTSALTVQRATENHLSIVQAFLADAARELHHRGIDQWPHPFPEHIVRSSISRRDTFLAWRGTEPVGTLAIYWDDVTFWGKRPADAGYVHRLVVPTSERGHGLGSRLLNWATEHVAAQGRQ